MYAFLPELPETYNWHLYAEDGHDVTDEYYAETAATTACIWREDADEPVLELTRTGDWGYWGPSGSEGEGGLRRWAIKGHCPEGLMDWEQFDTLSDVPHRLRLDKP